jgi:hypothetical protein
LNLDALSVVRTKSTSVDTLGASRSLLPVCSYDVFASARSMHPRGWNHRGAGRPLRLPNEEIRSAMSNRLESVRQFLQPGFQRSGTARCRRPRHGPSIIIGRHHRSMSPCVGGACTLLVCRPMSTVRLVCFVGLRHPLEELLRKGGGFYRHTLRSSTPSMSSRFFFCDGLCF